MWRFIFSPGRQEMSAGLLKAAVVAIVWCLAASQSQAQQRPSGSQSGRPPREGIKELFPERERDFRPSMLKLSYDMVPLGQTLFAPEKDGQSFQAMMDFDTYFLAVEYGTEQTERGEDFRYTNEGTYFSIGPEVNFLKNARNGNALTFGLRYGQASFSDQLSFSVNNSFFGSYDVVDGNPNLKARWMELTMGLQANVWKQLYLGYTVRYKVLRTVENIGTMAPYDVPGFGLYEDNNGVRFNFYLGWAIPLREKYPEEELDEN